MTCGRWVLVVVLVLLVSSACWRTPGAPTHHHGDDVGALGVDPSRSWARRGR